MVQCDEWLSWLDVVTEESLASCTKQENIMFEPGGKVMNDIWEKQLSKISALHIFQQVQHISWADRDSNWDCEVPAKVIMEIIRSPFVKNTDLISSLWAAVYLKICQIEKKHICGYNRLFLLVCNYSHFFSFQQSNHRSHKSSLCLCLNSLGYWAFKKNKKNQDLLSLRVLKSSLGFPPLLHFSPLWSCHPCFFFLVRKLSSVPTAGACICPHSTADVNISGQTSWNEL